MKKLPRGLKTNLKLLDYTTIKTGGPAKYFLSVKNFAQLRGATKWSKRNNLEVVVLGGGSNILVADSGFKGLIIKIERDDFIPIGEEKIECGAGLALSKAIKLSVSLGLTGLEWATGIPGTIAGAVRGNAGSFGGEMKDIVEEVEVYNCRNDQWIKLGNKECHFDYRESIFKKDSALIIFKVRLSLKKGDRNESKNKIRDIIEKRKQKQPIGMPSAGSFFKNPIVENKKLIKAFEKETGLKAKNNRLPAGWLIEEAGLKGKRIGGAMVSEKNSNFLVNVGKAKAEDFLILASVIKSRVRSRFNVQLQEEVQLVGF